jgi:hypothetical protein
VYMQAKGLLMLKTLLSFYHKGSSEQVLKYLPPEEAKACMELSVHNEDLSSIFISPEINLANVHYSWLTPVFKKISPAIHPWILSALSQQQASRLGPLVKSKPLKTSLSPLAQRFFLNFFYNKFKDPHVLPLSFLPPTPLTFLMKKSKEELVEAVDFLGLYDLAEEIRHVVDKNILKTVYQCLSPKKQQFLRICLHQKEKLAVSKLGLESWDKDCKKLEKMLHRRGINRLANALSGENPDFFWHVIHVLDTGRGAILSQSYIKEEIAGITPALRQQVINVFNFFKKEE